VSIGAIIAIVVVGLLLAFLVSVRIEVAKQRRAVEVTRARLAAAKVRRRSEGVSVEAILQIGQSIAHVPRKSTCALADDGLYCLSDDGRWGARVRFGAGAPGIGDVALAAPPVLVQGGKIVGEVTGNAADVPAWLATGLAKLPPDGILLQFQVGLSWLVAVPEPDAWFAALTAAIPAPGAAATS
jgi:hypothetical protein